MPGSQYLRAAQLDLEEKHLFPLYNKLCTLSCKMGKGKAGEGMASWINIVWICAWVTRLLVPQMNTTITGFSLNYFYWEFPDQAPKIQGYHHLPSRKGARLSFRAALGLLPWLAELVIARNHIQCIATGTAPSSPNIPNAHSKLVIIQSPP